MFCYEPYEELGVPLLIKKDKLVELKYICRPDSTDRISSERNFPDKFEDLNRACLKDDEPTRLHGKIFMPNTFAAAHPFREGDAFTREEAPPLNRTLINITDSCKSTVGLINLRCIKSDIRNGYGHFKKQRRHRKQTPPSLRSPARFCGQRSTIFNLRLRTTQPLNSGARPGPCLEGLSSRRTDPIEESPRLLTKLTIGFDISGLNAYEQ